jgi:hypothetical protein
VTLTGSDTTMTTGAPTAGIGSEPATAARDWLTLAQADQHPDRSPYVRFKLASDDLGASDEQNAAARDDLPHAAGRKAGS